MESLGERLLVARKAARLSLRDLAEKAGVSATAISKYERGLDIPSSGVLLALGRALNRRADFFLRSREVAITCPEFRKKADLGEKDKAAILAEVKEQSERYLEAMDLLTGGKSAPPPMPSHVRTVMSLDDAEAAAEGIRDRWKLGLDPIESLVDVLEDNGIHVLVVPGPTSFDAFTCRINGELPVIAVKDGVPGDRQRLSLAHELGHLVVQSGPGVDQESAAYRFGAAFLVPKQAALRELGNHRSALEIPDELHLLKHRYGISMQAWIVRARDLGIITPGTATQYFRMFRMRGWHRQEPGVPYPEERPTRLRQLVLRALAEEVLTESRAAELLGEPVRTWSSAEQHVSAA